MSPCRSRLLPVVLLGLLLLTGPLSGCGAAGQHAGSTGAAGAAAASSAELDSAEESGRDQERGEEEVAGTPSTVDCPSEATPVALPAGFRVPLPAGTVVVDVAHRDAGRTVVTGVVPAAEPDVLVQLQQTFPAAGLTLTEGETEARDAESDFTGSDGTTGRWGIRALEDCSPAATRIDLVVRGS